MVTKTPPSMSSAAMSLAAGAGGHTQVDSGTPYRGRGQPSAAGQAPTSPNQAEQPPSLPTTPQHRRRRHHP